MQTPWGIIEVGWDTDNQKVVCWGGNITFATISSENLNADEIHLREALAIMGLPATEFEYQCISLGDLQNRSFAELLTVPIVEGFLTQFWVTPIVAEEDPICVQVA